MDYSTDVSFDFKSVIDSLNHWIQLYIIDKHCKSGLSSKHCTSQLKSGSGEV